MDKLRTPESKAISGLYLSIVFLLVGFGIVMVYSSSSIGAAYDPRLADGMFFLRRQAIYLGLGLALMFGVSRLDYRILLNHAAALWIVTALLLLAVLVAGTEANNAKRWLNLGFKFQPSEVAKVTMVIAAAAFAVKQRHLLGDFKQGFVSSCAFVAPICALIIVQPDLGTSLFVGLLSFMVLVAGGLRLKHFLVVGAIALPLVITVMFFKFGHVQDRIMVFLDPEADPTGKGHQILQSWIALGSGGFEGKGIGESTQKLFYLPEEHTDFIYAILVEETGFIGGAFLIMLFVGLTWAGHRVSKHAPDRFGALIAFGCTMSIILQATINLAVVTGAAPTKGISLPFISFGGTGLVVALLNVGIVLSVARQAQTRKDALNTLSNENNEELRGVSPKPSRGLMNIGPGLTPASQTAGGAPEDMVRPL